MFRKNVAGQFLYFGLINATTGAALTGATVSARRCIDGTFAAGGGTVTEDSAANGFYKYAMSQGDTNGNNIGFFFTATNAVPVEKTIVTTGDVSNDLADALLDRSAGIETGITPRQGLRAILAAAAGKADGLAGSTVHYRDQADSKNRITATVDSDGNRTAVTLDVS